ncbi:hypothetical protein KEM54_002884 [Ascosphaera aggregata]|nr:hypothetical protein KEM54_002884 [Ascosphaera aggregata]
MTVKIGSRLSYDNSLCTVRYIGEVQGTKGQWLGVEWDDPTRGKHAGEHQGVKPADEPRGFLQAVREKYVSDERSSEQPKLPGMAGISQPIQFNGKIAQEIGFDKIRQKLSALQELKIILVDRLQVAGVLPNEHVVTKDEYEKELQRISETVPKIVELDLSWNLFESWGQVHDILVSLKRVVVG